MENNVICEETYRSKMPQIRFGGPTLLILFINDLIDYVNATSKGCAQLVVFPMILKR